MAVVPFQVTNLAVVETISVSLVNWTLFNLLLKIGNSCLLLGRLWWCRLCHLTLFLSTLSLSLGTLPRGLIHSTVCGGYLFLLEQKLFCRTKLVQELRRSIYHLTHGIVQNKVLKGLWQWLHNRLHLSLQGHLMAQDLLLVPIIFKTWSGEPSAILVFSIDHGMLILSDLECFSNISWRFSII